MLENLSNIPIQELLVPGSLIVAVLGTLLFFILKPKASQKSLENKEHTREISKDSLTQPTVAQQETKAPQEIPPSQDTPQPVQPELESQEEKRSWHARLVRGLQKTHMQLVKNLDELFLSNQDKLEREAIFEKLFEILVQADIGVKTTDYLMERVKESLSTKDLTNLETVKAALKQEMLKILQNTSQNSRGTLEVPQATPHVVLIVGVNGVGKTTTLGKLAYQSRQRGFKVVLGAADTYRAAAIEQLKIWAERADANFVALKEGADPASVAFEAYKQAKNNEAHFCFIDTAGRLHNRQDLMQELAKVRRVLGKENPEAPHEILLVLDATTGQNALQQAKIFKEVVDITGIILTKLDGTAKGGVVLAVCHELKLPIRYVGVGESVEDLHVFQADEFVNALFEEG